MAAVDEPERQARIVMSRVVEPGDPDACRLIREYSARDLLRRLRSGHSAGSPKVVAWSERASAADYDDVARDAEAASGRFLCPDDAEWDPALDDLERLEDEPGERRGGAPFGLWVRGDGHLAELTRRCVAIVGSRGSTAYGEHVAAGLAFDAAERGFAIVSGGAYGIDAAAHRAVVARSSPTIAVLAGGIDDLYPTGNATLLEEVCRTGGVLVSEAAPGCKPSRSRFLVRNRLIAALSQGTVVVEAALRSGALNTARWALDLGRGVMGVPGPVTSRVSTGVHELLRQPGTVLITDALEMIEHVSPVGVGLAPRKSGIVRQLDLLARESRLVLDHTPKAVPAPIQTIARDAGLTADDVRSHLTTLRGAGWVVERPDGWTLTP